MSKYGFLWVIWVILKKYGSKILIWVFMGLYGFYGSAVSPVMFRSNVIDSIGINTDDCVC